VDKERISVDLKAIDTFATLEGHWQALQSTSDHSFFQSWGWIGCWLRALPHDIVPWLLEVRLGDEIAGLGIVIEHKFRRRGVIVSKGLYLNETGRSDLDSLSIIHNGILTNRQLHADVEQAAIQFLASGVSDGRWHELHLSGVPRSYVTSARAMYGTLLVVTPEQNHYVDLNRIREAGGEYLAVLGKKTRRNIRQSIRLYEARGSLEFTVASSVPEALQFLDSLIDFHQSYWVSRRQPGAFAEPFFCGFHRELIKSRFRYGEIQLARVIVAAEPIGYQYNFVHGGRIYSYQSGLRYEANGNYRPGVVSDYLTILHNLKLGAAIYDFLRGDSLYKRTMATDARERFWCVLQQDRLDFRLENLARRLKRQYFDRP
jgi:CelD/BcsL family acetyltransferase involved in cellulose biosynthesis